MAATGGVRCSVSFQPPRLSREPVTSPRSCLVLTNSTMHREVLTKPAAELFGSLAQFFGFYLAGGTALALQIGHRVSVDFDLFSADEIDRGFLRRVRRAFPEAEVLPLINNADE